VLRSSIIVIFGKFSEFFFGGGEGGWQLFVYMGVRGKPQMFLISNFRHVLNIVFVLLGITDRGF
jgi:hypothetical protein